MQLVGGLFKSCARRKDRVDSGHFLHHHHLGWKMVCCQFLLLKLYRHENLHFVESTEVLEVKQILLSTRPYGHIIN